MMQRVLSRCAQNDRGATAVEFAIILPVLLLFVFGIIEWGLYMYNRQVITNAAREGARHGVIMRIAPRDVNEEDLAIKNKVLEYAQNYLVTFGADKLEAVDIDILPVGRSLAFGSDLTVQFEYTYDFLFLPLDSKIEGASIMKME